DGIRDFHVTGVQTCALPILMLRDGLDTIPDELRTLRANYTDPAIVSPSARADAYAKISAHDPEFASSRVGRQYAGLTLEQIAQRSEERRVGKEGSTGWAEAA